MKGPGQKGRCMGLPVPRVPGEVGIVTVSQRAGLREIRARRLAA